MDLHPACEPLGFLLGTWRGMGTGVYPTIDDFSYTEEAVFSHVGKPFVAYGQKTRDAATNQPLHAEAGYLRPVGSGRVELVLVQPSGIVELLEGTAGDGEISLASTTVLGTATAKPVIATLRRFQLEGGVLRSDVSMAAMGLDTQHHVASELYRVQ